MYVSEGLELRVIADREVGTLSSGVPLGLVLEIAALGHQGSLRRPVNLGFVLDCSGSMRGWRLDAAKSAALDVIRELREADSLSIVSFASEAEVNFSAPSMTAAARDEALAAIRGLKCRGATNLGEGYFVSAECVKEYMQAGVHAGGLIVLLTDGKANRGVVTPQRLAEKARELRTQGITTSAVGIGPDYSPRQIIALADAGRGRLHHCDHSGDIADVVLSEFGEAAEATFLETEVSIWGTGDVDIRLLGYQDEKPGQPGLTTSLGDLGSGVKRRLAVIVTSSDLAVSTGRLTFELSWRSERNGFNRRSATASYELMSTGGFARQRDLEIVAEVASRWEASLAYKAALLNEERRFEEASRLLVEDVPAFSRFVDGLPDASERVRRLEHASRRFGRSWGGAKKSLLMDLARKQARSEADYRRDPKGQWHEKL